MSRFMCRFGDDTEESAWWNPGGLAVYAYWPSAGELPILVIVKEWNEGDMKGVNVLWGFEHTGDQNADMIGEINRHFVEPLESQQLTARLIAEKKLCRVGPMPTLPEPDVVLLNNEILPSDSDGYVGSLTYRTFGLF